MVASTGFEAAELMVTLGATGVGVSASNTQMLFDVGVGASGAEQAIISNVAMGGNLSFSSWRFPIVIGQGSRVALRTRSAVASKAVTMGVYLMGGGAGMDAGRRATTYGAVTTGSRGTILTAPSLTNTEAAWTVIDAATANPMRWLVIGLAAPNTATATAANGLLDIGYGTSGQEAAVVADISFAVTASETIDNTYTLTFPVSIPSGSRLVARYRASATSTLASPNLTITGVD
jgi:hypothetical protein